MILAALAEQRLGDKNLTRGTEAEAARLAAGSRYCLKDHGTVEYS